MLATALPDRRLGAIDPVLLVILPLAMAVAIVGPFDRNIQIITSGDPLLRVASIAVVVVAGAVFAQQSGLSLLGNSARWPWIGMGCAIGVAMYVCLIDAFLFRSDLPLSYLHEIQGQGLKERLSYYFLRAFQENIIYRLFLYSALAWLFCRLRRTSATELTIVQAISIALVVQLVNVLSNTVSLEPASAIVPVYYAVRFVVPGTLWGFLYWRFGFATTELGHVACHAFLQPALGALL
ncbi:MAG TPA: hypothetical protein VHU18_11065 [Rhizomicrobium sp.]|jgi:hypothetical protein|nr:hypothetical protein [Rhizomicrobium sp.]